MFQYNKKKSANLQKLLFLFSRLCKSSRLELKNGFRGIKVQAELKPCVNKYETRNVAMLIFPFRAANGGEQRHKGKMTCQRRWRE